MAGGRVAEPRTPASGFRPHTLVFFSFGFPNDHHLGSQVPSGHRKDSPLPPVLGMWKSVPSWSLDTLSLLGDLYAGNPVSPGLDYALPGAEVSA